MELKGLFIVSIVSMCAFILLAMPYIDLNNKYSFDNDNYLQDNVNNYTTYLGNMQEDSKEYVDDSKEAGSKDRTTEGFFDIVGSLVQGGKDVVSTSVSSLEDSTKIIEDTKNNTKSIIPAIFFTALISIFFIFIMFSIIRYLTGR